MTTTYAACQSVSSSMNECNDCSVKALAITTSIDYQQAHKIMAILGRKNGKGFKVSRCGGSLVKAFTLAIKMAGRIAGNPHHPQGYTLQTIGERYNYGTWIVYTSGHVAALVDGKIDDWTAGSRRRVRVMIRVGV